MPEYLAPGVYIEEFEIGAKPIEGVSTSTVGFVGFAEKGPLNKPTLVTSFAEYKSIFGGYFSDEAYSDGDILKIIRWLPYAVDGFFSNGGKRAYIIRVAYKNKDNPNDVKNAKAACGYIPDISGMTSSLTKEAKQGSSVLWVHSLENIKVGDTMYLSDGSLSEDIQLRFADVAKPLFLNAPLASGCTTTSDSCKITVFTLASDIYTVKEKLDVESLKIKLDKVENLANNNLILLDTKENEEILLVSEVTPLEKSITLSTPLKLKHDSDVTIKKLNPPDNNSPHTKILMDTTAGDKVIPINKDFSINQYDAIIIGDTAQINLENCFLVAVIGDSGITTSSNLLISKEKLKYLHKLETVIKQLVKDVQVCASSEGTWGNRIKIVVSESKPLTVELTDNVSKDDTTLKLSTVNGMEKGTLLRITPPSQPPVYVTVNEVIKTDIKKVVLESSIGINIVGNDVKKTVISAVEFDLRIKSNGSEEIFKNISMKPAHSRYITKVINEESSGLIRIKVLDQADNILMPTQDAEPGWLLNDTVGKDGFPDINDISNDITKIYIGENDVNPEKRTGLRALQNREDISIVAIPGIYDQSVQTQIITQCEELKDRFAVLDPEEGADLDNVQKQRGLYDSEYAALYYPWLQVYDPVTGGQINVPPSGYVCGVYARTDTERGVHKAPANEIVNGALDLEKLPNSSFRNLTKGQQEVLNPQGINCIIFFQGRGIRVWGARTISSNSLWKYINVRRLFIFIEESIIRGTQDFVFEPNDEKLWGRIKATITEFLTRVWKDGALMGTKVEEAFFVKCDRTTMTQDDLDNGRLICIIGISPVKPAEFVIFRITQWVGGSSTTE
jgi:uncharacterized protein